MVHSTDNTEQYLIAMWDISLGLIFILGLNVIAAHVTDYSKPSNFFVCLPTKV